MANTNAPGTDPLQAQLFAEIDKRKRGRLKLAIVALMQAFGYNSSRRVHQASLEAVLSTLISWGVGYELQGGTSAYDDIVLFRLEPAAPEPALPQPAVTAQLSPAATHPQPASPAGETESLPALSSPLALLFHIEGMLEESRSNATAQAIQHSIWAFRPVCLFIDAGDEIFSFACGYVAALLRRRALTSRWSGGYDVAPVAPEIVGAQHLAHHLGQGDLLGIGGRFPASGAVYIVRENPEDPEDNELVRAVRERLLPHTYSLVARFGPTSANPDAETRLRDASQFSALFQWIAAFAGYPGAPEPATSQLVDISNLLAEAAQTRDALLDQRTLLPADSAFRAGFESTEHMALKSAMLSHLRQRFPGEEIAVEELVESTDAESLDMNIPTERQRRDKPDLRVGAKLWVEIETLRGVALNGSNPFFALETKLRQKLAGMRGVQEIWLLVPSDVALLGSEQVAAIARNLNAVLGAPKVRPGFIDLEQGLPVFLDTPEAPPLPAPRLTGVALRRTLTPVTQPRSLDDIAGYEDTKQLLQSNLLAPLTERRRYADFGIFAARGLLLYGLPGCGKSWIGHVLADIAGITSRVVYPSDLTSMWLGEGVSKTRALFDWAAKQGDCLMVLDELDAIAPPRDADQMHTDQKRQVNELLVQLDRISERGVILVATTNYLHGIDSAIQRSGRFDMKLPIFPPTHDDRRAIFGYYLSPPRLRGIVGADTIDLTTLAEQTTLFTPADIRGVVQAAARQSIARSREATPELATDDLLRAVQSHTRSVRGDQARRWLDEVSEDLGTSDSRVQWLRDEIQRAFG